MRTVSRVNLGYYLSETVLNKKLVCQLELKLYTPHAYTCSAPAPNKVNFSHFPHRNVWLENKQHSVCNYAYATISSLKDLSIVVNAVFSKTRTNNTKQQQEVLTSKVQVWLSRVAIAVTQQTKGKTDTKN